MYDYVDLFAGPGGWDVAAERLGLKGIGIEWDDAAVETRLAAGHETIHGDVRSFCPFDLWAKGLIASPPCPTFSAAGKGSGRAEMDKILEAASSLYVNGFHLEKFSDERTALVLEPLRWVMEAIGLLRPYEWIALEQVPAALPIWEHFAYLLRPEGYNVATGYVHSEQHGVPQTRKRAILVASRTRKVSLPTPTHSRYHSQNPGRLDAGVAPWVSMAEALGWTECDGYMRSNYGTGGDPSARGERPMAAPSPTVTSKIGRNRIYRTSTMPNATKREAAAPAPTIAFGKDAASAGWSSDEGFTRVTLEEASILQSFPRGYPWAGGQTAAFQQIGNAVPPLLAEAILRPLVKG